MQDEATVREIMRLSARIKELKEERDGTQVCLTEWVVRAQKAEEETANLRTELSWARMAEAKAVAEKGDDREH